MYFEMNHPPTNTNLQRFVDAKHAEKLDLTFD